MAGRLYEHLIKPLSVGNIKTQPVKKGAFETGAGAAVKKVWLNGRDHLENMNLNFTWGFYKQVGDWHGRRDLHVHPYPECHLFVGLDTANVNYLGAEVECRLGPEQESYNFSEPSVVIVPAGLPHGPVETKRIYSPGGFGSYSAGLSSIPETLWQDKPAQTAKSSGKYAHLVKPLKPFILTERGKLNPARFPPELAKQRAENLKSSRMKLGPGNADHLAWMFGSDLDGTKINMDWGFFSSAGLWHRGVGAHVHAVDEVLVFTGVDSDKPDYLGAEIEIDLGKEHERHLITRSSVVILPAGTPHAPIVTRWVDRPFAFFSINLASESVMQFID
ncbi:MAG TPA: hypothetical protein VLH15_08870 [Dehalococcoidales bacterium]|nr:hypothetical protein [Dehalococcoidales bacterium]